MTITYVVIFPEIGRKDLTEIILFAAQTNNLYAKRLLGDFEKRIRSLTHYPKKGRIVPELQQQHILEYRELIEQYWRIIYRIDERAARVTILGILDSRRNIGEELLRKLLAR